MLISIHSGSIAYQRCLVLTITLSQNEKSRIWRCSWTIPALDVGIEGLDLVTFQHKISNNKSNIPKILKTTVHIFCLIFHLLQSKHTISIKILMTSKFVKNVEIPLKLSKSRLKSMWFDKTDILYVGSSAKFWQFHQN